MNDIKNQLEQISKKTKELAGVDSKIKAVGENLYRNNALQRSGSKVETQKTIELAYILLNLPDVDIKNYEQVYNRITEFVSLHHEAQRKLTVNGLAMALNMDRHRLWEIATDSPRVMKDIPKPVLSLIKKFYNILAYEMEANMVEGKVNPAISIFLSKNHFGYKDVSDHVIEAKGQQHDNDFEEENIKNKYL